MADDIEVHFDDRNGRLWLNCGDEAFTRVLNVVLSEVDIYDLEIEGIPDAVTSLEVYQAPPPPRPTGVLDRVLLAGCGLIGFVILFLVAIGIRTLAGWIK